MVITWCMLCAIIILCPLIVVSAPSILRATLQVSLSHSRQAAFSGKRTIPEEQQMQGSPQTMRLMTQGELYRKLCEEKPDFLTNSWYPLADTKPLYMMTPEEKLKAFQKTVSSMKSRIDGGEKPEDVYYDSKEPRLFSGAVQCIFSIDQDTKDAMPEAVENLIATGLGNWGIGLVLDLLNVALNKDIPSYLFFKNLDIESISLTVANFPVLSQGAVAGTVNLRATEFMFAQVVCAVIRESQTCKGMVVELTEYTDDDHFVKFFGTEGTLTERLSNTLLPMLEMMKKKGVRIWVDDAKPKAVYKYDDEKQFKKKVPLEDHHATVVEMVFSARWMDVFERVKFSGDWVIHAFNLSTTTAPDYAKIALYNKELKVKPEYVAGVQGLCAPKDDTEAAGQLKSLQAAALASLQKYTERAKETFRLAPVLEASVTNEVVDTFPWLRGCAQQGGLLFELKSEPATLQCQVEGTPQMQGGYA